MWKIFILVAYPLVVYFKNIKNSFVNKKIVNNLKMTTKTDEIKVEKELDCSNASRGVWLVKVPKYIAKKWEKSKEKF